MNKLFSRSPRRESGVALVTTMIVVAILAVVAVAFMQSSTTDRISSRISSDYTQAKLAAQAAAAEAEFLVSRLVTRYPDSVTAWQNIGGGNSNEATVLYARAQEADTNAGARPGEFGSDVVLLARPLVSLAAQATNTNIVMFALTNANISNLLPFANAPTNNVMVNLNATNQWDPGAFIGLRSITNTSDGSSDTNELSVFEAPVAAAQWVYFGAQPGPTNATNPAIARYAFWVEDESFKVNLNVVTNGPRGTNSLGLGPGEIRIDGSLSNAALALDSSSLIQSREDLEGDALPSVLTALVPAGGTNRQKADAFRFLTTTRSAGLDLSRGGFKRFSINSITNGIDGTGDTNAIRTGLNRLIATITNSNSVPNFGQRFYRLATNSTGVNAANAVTNNHPAIYLNKIAANLLDYLDSNDQPTVINNDEGFTLRTGKPEFGIEPLGEGTDGTNSVVAVGVENVPRLQEYAVHGRIRQLNPIGYNSNSPPPDPVANYRISIDHYFEFWNPGTRDVTISNAFLKVYDQPSFGENITGPLANEGRPFEIPLNGITFPAGRVTVLTTAPEEELNERLVSAANRANVIHLDADAEDRIFEGETRDTSEGSAFGDNGYNTYFKVSMNPRTTGATDYQTAMVMGNDNGILESFGGLPVAGTGFTGQVPALHFVASSQQAADVVGETPDVLAAQNQYYTRAASLVGNSQITTFATPSSTEGDPRSLNEQLEFRLYTGDSITSREQTRFFNTIANNNGVPGTSSLGAPNTAANYVRPANWVDYSSLIAGDGNAPLFVRNDGMQSIGELGHITDAARVPGTGGALANVIYSRGGGRTLRIGQSEHARWYDGNQTNASRTWTSWRLADVFTTKNGLSVDGLVNPNGFLRDRGAAWRATLYGLDYLPAPEGVGLPSLNAFRINGMINTMAARLTNAGVAGLPAGVLNPFWERGELSELPLFNSGNIPTAMSNKFDRGREELVRRSIEMITTRGSVFTAYVVGQALQESATQTNVLSACRLKTTFELVPQFADEVVATDDFFAPGAAASRFVAPTNYQTRILSSSYD